MDLTSKPATHRVPKRAPPPPPTQTNRSTSHTSCKTGRSRPQSSIQLSQHQSTPQFHSMSPSSRRTRNQDLSCGGLSSSVTEIREEYSLDEDEQQGMQQRRSHMVSFEQPSHVYESLHPGSPPPGMGTDDELARSRSYFTRQSSAPSVMRHYHRVALPSYGNSRGTSRDEQSLNMAHPTTSVTPAPLNSYQFQPSHRDLSPSPQPVSLGGHANVRPQVQLPEQNAHAQSYPPPTSNPQSQAVELYNPRQQHRPEQRLLPSQSMNPHMQDIYTTRPQLLPEQQLHQSQPLSASPQTQAVEVYTPRQQQQQLTQPHNMQPQAIELYSQRPQDINEQHLAQQLAHSQPQSRMQSQAVELYNGGRPQPKPRSSVIVDQNMATQPISIPVIQGNSVHNAAQQYSTAQHVTGFPGQTQLQTYSFAQQSSIFNMPGLVQNPSVIQHSPPFFSAYPSNPPTLNIQILPQDHRPHSSREDRHRSTEERSDEEVPSHPSTTKRSRSLSEPHTPKLKEMTRQQSESACQSPARRPVPKPRRAKKQSAEPEFMASGGERSSTVPQDLAFELEVSGI